jgi:hypothetical protein
VSTVTEAHKIEVPAVVNISLAAILLGESRQTIYAMLKRGDLTRVYFGEGFGRPAVATADLGDATLEKYLRALAKLQAARKIYRENHPQLPRGRSRPAFTERPPDGQRRPAA